MKITINDCINYILPEKVKLQTSEKDFFFNIIKRSEEEKTFYKSIPIQINV